MSAQDRTVGILARDHLVASDLFYEVTKLVSRRWAQQDQDHPEIVVYARDLESVSLQGKKMSEAFKIYEGTKTLKEMGAEIVIALDKFSSGMEKNMLVDMVSPHDPRPLTRPSNYDDFLRYHFDDFACHAYKNRLHELAEIVVKASENNLNPSSASHVIANGKENSVFDMIIDKAAYLPNGKIGIFGGFGPAAGGAGFKLTIDKAEKRLGNGEVLPAMVFTSPAKTVHRVNYINYVLWDEYRTKGVSEPIVPNVEHEPPNPVPAMADTFIRLDKAGCDAVFMCCNTAHRLLPLVDIEIGNRQVNLHSQRVNIIEETAREMVHNKGKGIMPVGLLATTTTISSGMYIKALREVGRNNEIKIIHPDTAVTHLRADIIKVPGTGFDPNDYPHSQARVHDGIIYGGIKGGDYERAAYNMFVAINHLERKAAKELNTHRSEFEGILPIIAGCTEIPLAFSELYKRVNAGKEMPDHNPVAVLINPLEYAAVRAIEIAMERARERSGAGTVKSILQQQNNIQEADQFGLG